MGGEWEDVRRVVARIAGEAAGLLRDISCDEAFLRREAGETIRADVESEEYIIDAIRREGFGGVVVTEERGLVRLGGEGPVFVVDPLDGSTNYASCIPWASVSLAAAPPGARRLSQVVAGAVAPVFYGEIISFSKGAGCRLGETPVSPSAGSRMLYVYVEHPEAALGLAKITKSMGGLKVRSLGSAALEMAYTAIGRGFAFVDLRSKLRNVDVAAALGLTRECGGSAIGAEGEPLDAGLEGVERVGTVISSHDPRVPGKILEILKGGV